MEPQVEIYCKKEDKKKNCSCLWIILFIIAITLSFFVGALIEALTEFVILLGIGAVVVLVISLLLLLIIAIINVICCKKNNRKKYCC